MPCVAGYESRSGSVGAPLKSTDLQSTPSIVRVFTPPGLGALAWAKEWHAFHAVPSQRGVAPWALHEETDV